MVAHTENDDVIHLISARKATKKYYCVSDKSGYGNYVFIQPWFLIGTYDVDLFENPELTPEMFARAIVRRGLRPPSGKIQLTLRVDRDVVEWFKKRGRGYQTKINALLRAYMDAHK